MKSGTAFEPAGPTFYHYGYNTRSPPTHKASGGRGATVNCEPGTVNLYTYDIVTSVTGHMFMAESPEAFSCDVDGNLLSDGRFAYAWDADPPSPRLWRTLNPVVAMETYTNKVGTAVPAVRLEFAYDYMSRRVGKRVYVWDSDSWLLSSEYSYLYDSWNLISEQTHEQTNAQTNFFTFGLDLSGSLQGAGGVGGLLSAVFGGTSSTSSVCYTYDGNGNVSELVDSGTGAILAHYEYSPFGETIVATGDLAKDNPFRFSTKYTDDETTLVYYGYRYYSPGLGRWVSRDPLSDLGIWQRRKNFNAGFPSTLGDLPEIVKSQECGASILNFENEFIYEEYLSRMYEFEAYRYVANDPIMQIDILGGSKSKCPEFISSFPWPGSRCSKKDAGKTKTRPDVSYCTTPNGLPCCKTGKNDGMYGLVDCVYTCTYQLTDWWGDKYAYTSSGERNVRTPYNTHIKNKCTCIK